MGSAATGFRDQYSDIDVVLVARAGETKAALGALHRHVSSTLKAVFNTTYQHHDEIYVSCLLLENGLELDIGVWSIDVLFCAKPSWRLLHAGDPTNAASIGRAMSDNPRAARWDRPIVTGDAKLWQFIYGMVVAAFRTEALERSRGLLATHQAEQHDLAPPAIDSELAIFRSFLLSLIARSVAEVHQSALLAKLVAEAYSAPGSAASAS